ncbi:protein kinase [Pelagibius sp.]|uniref:protein kinase domain-containing protein n=1 Tax=Pelagibius sp. TaxID=1931238 RepID=UPI002607EEBC|nr:protein kinase [Pelagibius sp.]
MSDRPQGGGGSRSGGGSFGARDPGGPGIFEVGTLISYTYRVDALLARGGMGEVYRTTHTEIGTEHAIKIVRPDLANDEKIMELFRREASVLRTVREDAIVGYDGVLRDEEGRVYLVMEFVDGPSLSSYLQDRILTPQEVRDLRDRLARGLAAAHDKGVIHRDMSPDNIILGQGELAQAKIIDFGIAKLADSSATTIIGDDFAGRYAYASPEQIGLYGGQVDARSDIYSLGLVLATAGTGRALNMGEISESLVSVIEARKRVPDFSSVPEVLRTELGAMLQPDPADRPQTMREVIGLDARLEAQAAAAEEPAQAAQRQDPAGPLAAEVAARATPSTGERGRAWLWPALAVGLAAAGAAGYLLWPGGQPAVEPQAEAPQVPVPQAPEPQGEATQAEAPRAADPVVPPAPAPAETAATPPLPEADASADLPMDAEADSGPEVEAESPSESEIAAETVAPVAAEQPQGPQDLEEPDEEVAPEVAAASPQPADEGPQAAPADADVPEEPVAPEQIPETVAEPEPPAEASASPPETVAAEAVEETATADPVPEVVADEPGAPEAAGSSDTLATARGEDEPASQSEAAEPLPAEDQAGAGAEETAELEAAPEESEQVAALPEPSAVDLREAALKAAEAQLTREEKREIQRDLRALGHYRGGIDGQFGPGTRAGIETFQRVAGLEVTGYLSDGQRSELAQSAAGPRAELEARLAEERQAAAAKEAAEKAAAEKAAAEQTAAEAAAARAQAVAGQRDAAAPQPPPAPLGQQQAALPGESELDRLRRIAEAGDPVAQASLGLRYYRGQGVRRDLEEAFRWTELAAQQGEARAQSNLGFYYMNGEGVGRDPAQAARWWQAAASQGLPQAQYNLGLLYETGRGVAADPREAAKWYRLAVAQGDRQAKTRLDGLVRRGLVEAEE